MNDILKDAQLFAELYDAHPQAIFWMYPILEKDSGDITDFKFAYINNEGLNYLRLTPKQVDELTLLTSPTLTPDLRQQVFDQMVTVYQSGRKLETSFFNPALNKHARILRIRLRGGVLTIVQDITGEKQVIQQLEAQSIELRDQKTLLDNILKNSSNGISVSRVFRDENGTVVDAQTILANDAAVRYIGLPREIYLTKRATEIEPEVIGSPYYQACIKTLETGEPFVMQYRMVSTGRWLELTVSRMDHDHLIQVFTDVTPIKEAQLQLEKTVFDLKRSNTNLEDFAYAASHDMKEPLRKILIFAQRLKALLEARMTAEETKLLERIHWSAERLQLLVDDLLEFSQINVKPRETETIDLNVKVQKVLADLELSIEEKKARITVAPLPTVQGDRRQLQQLFQNLLSNALKYSKPNEPPQINIQYRAVKGADAPFSIPPEQKENRFHLIEVSDNGIGFEPRYAELIFELFKRLHGKGEYTGTGVGLAITKKVVENHGGYIKATAQPGMGATFHILLPVT